MGFTSQPNHYYEGHAKSNSEIELKNIFMLFLIFLENMDGPTSELG